MARRGRGEGSVYRRSDGRWVARAHLGWADGKPVRRSFYGRTRAEAVGKLARFERQRIRVSTSMRLGEWLDYWLDRDATKRSRPGTMKNRRSHVENHIRPALGRVQLEALTPSDVQEFVDAIDLAPATVATIVGTLRTALNRAVAFGLLQHNPVTVVTLPRRVRAARRVLSPGEVATLLASFEGDRDEALFWVAAGCGLRQGEVLGLTWGAIDLPGRRLTVSQTLVRVPRAGLRLAQPKTPSSVRTIALPELVARQLERHAGEAADRSPDALVFPSVNGTPRDHNSVRRRLKRRLAALGLPDQRFHDLRHACATMLLAAGTPIRDVMGLLGHTQVATTIDIYGHVLDASKDRAAGAIDELLSRAGVDKGVTGEPDRSEHSGDGTCE